MVERAATLILASRSPRRRELLAAAGYRFEVWLPSDEAEDGACCGETPDELVVRLARQKAVDVARRVSTLPSPLGGLGEDLSDSRIVVGCDTVAECDGEVLGKPDDEADARRMLETLSGREHRVLSGLCLIRLPDAEPLVRVAVTKLRMDRLSAEQLDIYLAGGQWQGKAGAFGYQDGIDWVHVIDGSESNVVGLPMELLAEMIESVMRH